MAQWLSERLGQQFIVENRAGSGGYIATEAAIGATPDGYTLLFSGANNAISASLQVQLIFDNLPTALAQARGGSVRALGVSSPQRWPGLSDIPAIAETVPGYESSVFY
jgi:tripartite-type tricarboxylate transporter receptor subunit TctC